MLDGILTGHLGVWGPGACGQHVMLIYLQRWCLLWASLQCVYNTYPLSHSHSVRGRTRPGGANSIVPLVCMKTSCGHLHTTFGFSHHKKKTLCVFPSCLASFDCWNMSRNMLHSIVAFGHPKTLFKDIEIHFLSKNPTSNCFALKLLPHHRAIYGLLKY